MNKKQMIDRAIEVLKGNFDKSYAGSSSTRDYLWFLECEGIYQRLTSYSLNYAGQYICTRKEFEDRVEELNNMKDVKLQKLTKEWGGVGLPPVGTLCEGVYDGEWVKVKVLEHCENDQRSDVGACRIVDGGVGYLRYVTEFRPIKTEKDLIIEKAHKIVEKVYTSCDKPFLEALYDAGMLVTPKKGS